MKNIKYKFKTVNLKTSILRKSQKIINFKSFGNKMFKSIGAKNRVFYDFLKKCIRLLTVLLPLKSYGTKYLSKKIMWLHHHLSLPSLPIIVSYLVDLTGRSVFPRDAHLPHHEWLWSLCQHKWLRGSQADIVSRTTSTIH